MSRTLLSMATYVMGAEENLMRKKSKGKIRVIQDLIWKECRRIKDKPIVNCYTCEAKNLQGCNKQLGHMWAKASVGANLKYELDILEWQCMRCNQFLGGMGADFYKRKLKEIGSKRMKELEKLRNESVKAMDHYEQLLKEYEKLNKRN
jgi:hypothetical protein